jgi:hypothetical protein
MIPRRGILSRVCFVWTGVEVIAFEVELVNVSAELVLGSKGIICCKFSIISKMNPFVIAELVLADFQILED